MKYILAILTSFICSCSYHPIKTAAKINRTNLSTSDAVVIKISARNTSKKIVTIPNINSLGTDKGISSNEIRFKPDALYYSDFAVLRDYPSENYIPITDTFKPDESKTFTFYWYPTKRERGSGALSVFLPSAFQPVDPLRIEIN